MRGDLYHQAILDLAHQATGYGRLEAPQASVRVDNPLCGDRVSLDLNLENGRVRELRHVVRGCLLCQAAAAVIGARAPGETPEALARTSSRLRELIIGGAKGGDVQAVNELWPELRAFTPVHSYKARHECVLLPFGALSKALNQALSTSH